MDETKTGEHVEETPSSAPITTEPSVDNPLDAEIARHKEVVVRTEPEKAAFTLQKNAERARELGLDPVEVLGLKQKEGGTPMTVEMFEELQRKNASQSALQLAETTIDDPKELELTKIYLAEKIKPSGNAAEDLRIARLMVNSVKHSQIAEHIAVAGTPKTHVSSPGAPAASKPQEAELTPEETRTMRAFKLTKEQVLAARM